MKYMGSKAKFAKYILPILLSDKKSDQWYVEPFAGGMNIIDKIPGKRLANDINPYLIALWKALVYDNFKLEKVTEEFYKEVRDNKSKYEPHIVGSVGCTGGFRGMFFGSYNNKLTRKTRIERDYHMDAINSIMKQVKHMQNVKFTNKNYYELEIPPNSIIYCDPPYEGVTQYSRNRYKYTIDYKFFWDWVREQSKIGHTIYVSEYNAPSDFECVWSKEVKVVLATNIKVNKQRIRKEKLFRLKK